MTIPGYFRLCHLSRSFVHTHSSEVGTVSKIPQNKIRKPFQNDFLDVTTSIFRHPCIDFSCKPLFYQKNCLPLQSTSRGTRILHSTLERWQSGRMRRSWKPLILTGPGVRIPLSPQNTENQHQACLSADFFVFCSSPPQAGRDVGAPQRDEIGSGVKPCV